MGIPTCSLVISGNKDSKGEFTDKIDWIKRIIKPHSFVQLDVNKMQCEYANIPLYVYLIQGYQDAIKLIPNICCNNSMVILNGACCSLSKQLNIGDIFIPNYAKYKTNPLINFSTHLVEYARKTTEEYRIDYRIGGILHVDAFVTSFQDIESCYKDIPDTCIDQETALLSEACENSNIHYYAILYISDNIPLEYSINVVNSNPAYYKKKMFAKKTSLQIAINTLIKWRNDYESL